MLEKLGRVSHFRRTTHLEKYIHKRLAFTLLPTYGTITHALPKTIVGQTRHAGLRSNMLTAHYINLK